MSAYEIALEEAQKASIKTNLIAPRGFNYKYCRYRILRPLLKLNYKGFKMFHRVTPWTSQAAIRTFDRVITKDMKGLEYGSGFSTLYFAKRIGQLVSVEHHTDWHKLVGEMIRKEGIQNVDYHLIPRGAPGGLLQFDFEQFGFKKGEFSIRQEYAAYFSFITTFPELHFDFIMVDGRARVECCLLAISKLKHGGIFVLDNSDRARYEPVFRYLKDWKMVTTTTGLFDTTFWFKP